MVKNSNNNISTSPILDEGNVARQLAAEKALARKQNQTKNILAELGKTPSTEPVSLEKGDIGAERALPEGEEVIPEAEEREEEEKQNAATQQQSAAQAAGAAMLTGQQQRTSQIRRAIQHRIQQMETGGTRIKNFRKKQAALRKRLQSAEKITKILRTIMICTVIGAILAFFIKHIVNFFFDPKKIQGQIDSLNKKITKEERNRDQLKKGLRGAYRTMNQIQQL